MSKAPKHRHNVRYNPVVSAEGKTLATTHPEPLRIVTVDPLADIQRRKANASKIRSIAKKLRGVGTSKSTGDRPKGLEWLRSKPEDFQIDFWELFLPPERLKVTRENLWAPFLSHGTRVLGAKSWKGHISVLEVWKNLPGHIKDRWKTAVESVLAQKSQAVEPAKERAPVMDYHTFLVPSQLHQTTEVGASAGSMPPLLPRGTSQGLSIGSHTTDTLTPQSVSTKRNEKATVLILVVRQLGPR